MLAVLLQAAVPRLAEIERMTPVEAGAVVLRGRAHEPIDAVETNSTDPLPFPNIVERYLIGRPVRAGTGCVRRRWRAQFELPATGDVAAAALQSVNATTEVAPAMAGACPTTEYVRLNPYLEAPVALNVLTLAERIRTGRQVATFACTDETGGTDFCTSRESILRDLAGRRPGIMTQEQGGFAVSFFGRRRAVVTMQVDPRTQNRVSVERSYPAPF
ncbi:MAG: hypothetical protein PGN21_00860 [Sphingomonas paucimobilis]